MIEVKNLVKKYGNHLAVDHLNFKIESGRIYCFMGPNGAGKSTTMNIMTGYLGATEGEVFINGHNILKEPRGEKAYRLSARAAAVVHGYDGEGIFRVCGRIKRHQEGKT